MSLKIYVLQYNNIFIVKFWLIHYVNLKIIQLLVVRLKKFN